jgi:quinol monooxygenase YgiN
MSIARQLRHSKGLLGYALRADLISHRFWTLSAWKDEASLQAFVRAEPHASTMRELSRYTKDPAFANWTTQSPLPLPSWQEVEDRLRMSKEQAA